MKNNLGISKIFVSSKINNILLFLFAILIGGGGYILYQNMNKPEAVHLHAGFQVYTEGKMLDFSDWKYMHVVPCNADGSYEVKDEQMEKAHLHDQIGDVVHVHRSNAKWGDLFQNINFSIPDDKQVRAYINGEIVEDIESYQIEPYDRLVLIIGQAENVEALLTKQVSKEHILEIEKRSEYCGSE